MSLASIIRGLRARWKLLPYGVLIAWAFGLSYYFFVPQTFSAHSEFYYFDSENASGGTQPLGGLAGLAASGLGLGRSSGREIALATLKSRQMAEQFVQKKNLLPVLFPEKWDEVKRQWAVPSDKIPTPSLGAARFLKFRIVKDDATAGSLSVSITMRRRDLVAPLTNDYVSMVDEVLRQRSLQQSRDSINYLQSQLATATTAELHSSIIGVMETQLQKMTLTKTGRYFAFQIVDPAIMPIEHDGPPISVMMAILTLLGLAGAILVSVFLDARRRDQGA